MSSYRTSIEIDITVHYQAHKAIKGARDCGRYLQIEPDEPAHIEIDWIEGPNGNPIELTRNQQHRLMDEILADEYDRSLPYED